ncbi:mandelate racemase/muconate lactonizing enzyme family protein [Frigidibacter sp. ROC022]|uniref:mandelate racemase/muconate lactonizing enzyme family protein n=1 Tax=Frigidibacter sp. ROC022 TaxID=2971796 RepID=UPI00215B69D4|nr:mandelate racemase/muconate lactonizing enzyme family protein [Frigidibacter sp. ROC022]MCR8724640.1 mandelate racemase/muconate lactonizing enzyme family protein [Frigidibacter sp. ROC022]
MADRITSLDCFFFERPRDTPYLGALAPDDLKLGDHYIVRAFNGTVYPHNDRSVVVRVRDSQGREGWGETYGLVAAKATVEIIRDIFAPYVMQVDVDDPARVWDGFYNLMRVRGYWGGYYADAMAAVDTALWDLKGRREGRTLRALLSDRPLDSLPAYISGLPGDTAEARDEMATGFRDQGFDSLKLPISVAPDSIVDEVARLRQLLGEEHRIAVDMHWAFEVDTAIALIEGLSRHGLWFAEAPIMPEDVVGQSAVAAGIGVPLALGEEWRTEWDIRPRITGRACSIVQPEMGHTGVTQFMRIGRLAKGAGMQVVPHATVGLGIFMSASLNAAAALGAEAHEYQHSIYDRNAALLDGAAACTTGRYAMPEAAGHGVTPNEEAFRFLELIH